MIRIDEDTLVMFVTGKSKNYCKKKARCILRKKGFVAKRGGVVWFKESLVILGETAKNSHVFELRLLEIPIPHRSDYTTDTIFPTDEVYEIARTARNRVERL